MFSTSKPNNHPPIYLDYNATTPPSENVKNSILDILDIYGNPSSTHKIGMQANKILEDSREDIATHLNLDPRKILFTSGATESNNIIFNSHEGLIITCISEHASIVNPIKARKEQGCIVPICASGYIDLDILTHTLETHRKNRKANQSILLSLSLVNGVNGVIAPLDEIMALVKKYDILIHWDCTQALGKMSLDMDRLNPDYLVASGHKIGALKGVGILYYRNRSQIKIMSHGGGQELGLRSGTENILAIHSLSQAVKDINISHYHEHTSKLLDHIHKRITDKITDKITDNNHKEIFLFSRYSTINTIHTINNTLILAMKRQTSAQQFMLLDMNNIAVSIGSACTSSDINVNNWLAPQEISSDYTNLSQSILRISIGLQTTRAEVDIFIDKWLSMYLG